MNYNKYSPEIHCSETVKNYADLLICNVQLIGYHKSSNPCKNNRQVTKLKFAQKNIEMSQTSCQWHKQFHSKAVSASTTRNSNKHRSLNIVLSNLFFNCSVLDCDLNNLGAFHIYWTLCFKQSQHHKLDCKRDHEKKHCFSNPDVI